MHKPTEWLMVTRMRSQRCKNSDCARAIARCARAIARCARAIARCRRPIARCTRPIDAVPPSFCPFRVPYVYSTGNLLYLLLRARSHIVCSYVSKLALPFFLTFHSSNQLSENETDHIPSLHLLTTCGFSLAIPGAK